MSVLALVVALTGVVEAIRVPLVRDTQGQTQGQKARWVRQPEPAKIDKTGAIEASESAITISYGDKTNTVTWSGLPDRVEAGQNVTLTRVPPPKVIKFSILGDTTSAPVAPPSPDAQVWVLKSTDVDPQKIAENDAKLPERERKHWQISATSASGLLQAPIGDDNSDTGRWMKVSLEFSGAMPATLKPGDSFDITMTATAGPENNIAKGQAIGGAVTSSLSVTRTPPDVPAGAGALGQFVASRKITYHVRVPMDQGSWGDFTVSLVLSGYGALTVAHYERVKEAGQAATGGSGGTGPTGPAEAMVVSATKTCTPVDAYPRIPAQGAAGPSFPAILAQPPTQITCTLEADVVLRATLGLVGPVNLTIFDGLSPGIFFDRLVPPTQGTTVASYTNNLVTFDPIRLELPPQIFRQSFPIKLVYTAFLNDLAEQRFPQQNCITLRFTDAVTGNVMFNHPGLCADITPLIPRLSVIKYAGSTTGLPGDRKTFTVVVYNTGNIFLQNVNVDALIPNATTLDPASLNPPGVPGNQWRGLGPINAGGSLAVSYAVTINANTPEGTQLVDRAFVTATTPNFAGAGARQLNASSDAVVVTISPIRTGVELTLTVSRMQRNDTSPRKETTATEGCPLQVVTYNAKVTNTGQVTLDRLRLSIYQGTQPLAGNPTFPLALDPLGPGESRTISYKGQLGLRQRGWLVDVANIVGRPVNNDVQTAPLVGTVATATVRVLPPAISKITPATAPQGSKDVELNIEGVCFVPTTVVGFQPGDGVEIIPPRPPDYGFVGSAALRRSINIKADAQPGEREVSVVNPNGEAGGNGPFNVFTVFSAPGPRPATSAPGSMPPAVPGPRPAVSSAPGPRPASADPRLPTGSLTDDEIRKLEMEEDAEKGNSPEVKALLSKGGNPNGKDSVFGRTALMWAITRNDIEAFQRLLSIGANPNGAGTDGMPVLYFAIQNGSAWSVQALLDQGVDVNRPPASESPRPLTVASALGHLDIVRALLSRKADVNAPDAFGRTALMLAADNGAVEVVRLLAQEGALLEATDNRGRTALAYAIDEHHEPPLPAFQRKQENRVKVAELLRQLSAKR